MHSPLSLIVTTSVFGNWLGDEECHENLKSYIASTGWEQ
jgi:hypothetical protein